MFSLQLLHPNDSSNVDAQVCERENEEQFFRMNVERETRREERRNRLQPSFAERWSRNDDADGRGQTFSTDVSLMETIYSEREDFASLKQFYLYTENFLRTGIFHFVFAQSSTTVRSLLICSTYSFVRGQCRCSRTARGEGEDVFESNRWKKIVL